MLQHLHLRTLISCVNYEKYFRLKFRRLTLLWSEQIRLQKARHRLDPLPKFSQEKNSKFRTIGQAVRLVPDLQNKQL